MIRLTRPVIAGLLCAAAIAACKKSSNEYAAGNVDTLAAKTMDTAAAAASATAVTPNAGKWTPPAILGLAWAGNSGELMVARLGETKATNAEVRAFARGMAAQHPAMMAANKKLAAKLNATPDTTGADVQSALTHSRDEMKDLANATKGKDWDKTYMDKVVDDHQAMLGKLQDMSKDNTDPELAKALTDATTKTQAMLTKAQELQAKLNK